jgi:hypothetical protein
VPVTFMLEPATGAVHGTAEGMGSDGAFGPIAGSGRPASMASTTLPASATARMPAAALARPAGPLLVQRGAWVDLVLGEGGIRLQARAQALAAGTLDAVIPVQATHGGTVSARVVGAGRVEALP